MSTTGAPPLDGRPSPGHARALRVGHWQAISVGIVAVGLALAGGELLAAVAAWLGLLGAVASPFSSLGAAFIAITPGWLKDVGIGLFGQSDKVALAVSMVVTFAILGVLLGLVARVSVRAGIGLGVLMLAVTAVAILTRSGAGVADLIPIALGGVAGIWYLRRALGPARDPYAAIHARAAAGLDGAGHDGAEHNGVEHIGAGHTAAGVRAEPGSGVDRRRVLQVTGVGALVAVLAGALSKAVPSVVDVQANRAAVTLPPVGVRAGNAAQTGRATATNGGEPSPNGAGPATGKGLVAAPGRATAEVPPALPADVNPAVVGLTPYVTPDNSFYRVDTAFTLPRLTTEAWRLRVHGMVERPFEITWADLTALPQVERWITLACVSNEVGGDLVGNAAWQGVRIADLLARAHPTAGADCVLSTSADNFTVTTPLGVLTDGRDALLAIGMNGAPLPLDHGFPVRMVVPGLYGYVSATKWVVDMEVTTFAHATAYWTERGWAPRGPVKTASRIDTPGYDVTVGPGTVPVAGVAWAQHRGISAVQVQVDRGPWRAAELYGAASVDTWVQWVFRWDTRGLAPGRHVLRCRAVDGTGAVQDGTLRPVAPNGATGYDSVSVVTR